jgi:hypothetical protein
MTIVDRHLVTSVETYCGHYLDYLDPRVEHVEVADVARGLANTCRFAGQTVKYFSVAEHAVYVSERVVEAGYPELAFAALHHDSHEAYLGDWPSPLKYVFDSELLEKLRNDIDRAVAERFGFDQDLLYHQAVKDADYLQLRREAATLKHSHGVGPHWRNEESFLPMAGTCWSPDRAERKFLEAHARLTGNRIHV